MVSNKNHEHGSISWHPLFPHLDSRPLNLTLRFLFLVTSSSIILVLVYVDDIIITGSDVTFVNSLISSLISQFSLKYLGPLHFFLGIQVTTQTDGIHLSQPQYLRDFLICAKMNDAKPCSTPFSTGDPLSKFDGSPKVDPYLYRSRCTPICNNNLTRYFLCCQQNIAIHAFSH
jgi:Reverse transcriptase (RNA-dependent DNA polymerase)